MKKLLNKLFPEKTLGIHTGRGYIQGTGFDVVCKSRTIFGISFITAVNVSQDVEWLRTLKKRIKADDKQQKLERIDND